MASQKLTNAMSMKAAIAEKEKRVKELQVLNVELSSLKPGKKVYKQQPNSNMFFRDDIGRVMASAKQELDSLVEEYKRIEKTQEELVEDK